jgi:hypothetical protein
MVIIGSDDVTRGMGPVVDNSESDDKVSGENKSNTTQQTIINEYLSESAVESSQILLKSLELDTVIDHISPNINSYSSPPNVFYAEGLSNNDVNLSLINELIEPINIRNATSSDLSLPSLNLTSNSASINDNFHDNSDNSNDISIIDTKHHVQKSNTLFDALNSVRSIDGYSQLTLSGGTPGTTTDGSEFLSLDDVLNHKDDVEEKINEVDDGNNDGNNDSNNNNNNNNNKEMKHNIISSFVTEEEEIAINNENNKSVINTSNNEIEDIDELLNKNPISKLNNMRITRSLDPNEKLSWAVTTYLDEAIYDTLRPKLAMVYIYIFIIAIVSFVKLFYLYVNYYYLF